MPKRKPTDSFFYRRRFILAYAILSVALVGLIARAFSLANGVTAAEQVSVMASLKGGIIEVNAPYYILQDLSLHLFGLSALGIKAASLILGALSVPCLLLLMSRWTRRSTGIATALILASGVTFLMLSATGSPAVLYVFYPLALLLLGTYLIEKRRSRFIALVALVVVTGLALLTPGLIYIIGAGAAVSLLSPHIRYGIRRLGTAGIGGLVIGTLAALVPLALLALRDMSQLHTVLLLDSFDTAELPAHLSTLAALLFGFFAPGLSGPLPLPLVGLTVFGLALIGLIVTLRSLYAARSRFLITWLVVSLILSVIQPSLAVLVFTMLVLFAGLAIEWIARYWYVMFPLNPYARLFGLTLIIVLVAGTVVSNILRFEGTIGYAAGNKTLYSQDLDLILHTNTREKSAPMTLIVSDHEQKFYDGLSLTHPNITVAANPQSPATNGYVLSRAALGSRLPTEIITDSRSNDADRFYLYRTAD